MKTKTLFLVLVLALFLGVAGAALAQGDNVELPRWTLSGGASDSVAGNVILRATLGQPVVGVVASGGGDITLGQGFWHGGVAEYRIYLPLVLR